MPKFEGKVAFITGASAGVGAATAHRFAKEGASVSLIARRKEQGEQIVAEIENIGGRAIFSQVDVTDADGVEAAVARTIEMFGSLDIGVNNAAILGAFAPIMEMDDANWLDVLNVNLNGVFFAMRAEARAMQASGGSIINVASVNAFMGSPGAAAYATSKHAILGLARSACQEFAPFNIRINTVCPGLIDTDMQRDIATRVAGEDAASFEHPLIARIPLGRMSSADEITSAIAWLASDDASYVTGSTITPDGGLMA
ncbi:MAG: glucose 1-dehydrogenase [Aquisalinus sp.]|nr:glucose 1-dehydrogenase [Aquisalinus sp.]